MASSEQFAMPVQDGLGADQQQKVPQSVFGEVMEQAGEDGTVASVKLGLLTLQDKQLVLEDEDLDVLVSVARRQEA